MLSGACRRAALGAVLALTLMWGAAETARAQRAQAAGDGAAQAAQVRARVRKIGAGERARVSVKLQSGRKLEGYIGQIGEEHFYLIRTDGEKGTAAVVAFADVHSLEQRRGDLSWRDVIYRTGLGAGAVLGFLRGLGATITPAFPAAP